MKILQIIDDRSFIVEYFTEITSLISVILTGVYVYFTIKTFIQIKQQTDLQLKAYLNVEDSLTNETELNSNKIDTSFLDRGFANDWKLSMEKQYPQLMDFNGLEGGFYSLHFTNYGNTEIKNIIISSNIYIRNSQKNVDEKKLTAIEMKEFNVEIKKIIKNDETTIVPLFSTAAFPIFDITTTITYIDVRDQEYNYEIIDYKNQNKHLQ